MHDKPLISVIAPVYGVEQYIGGCMESIVNQTFCDYEVILVDDGSKDNSIGVAKRMLAKSQIQYRIITQTNQGQGIARETGVEHANGEWIVFLDSDDTVAPDFLQVLYSLTMINSVEIAMVSYKMVSEPTMNDYDTPQMHSITIDRNEMLYRFLIRKEPPIIPAMIIRRSLFVDNDIRLNTRCRFSEDIYIMWKLFACANEVAYKPDALYNYLVRPNSTMTASKKDNILTGYNAMKELSDSFSNIYNGFLLQDLILPRWILGALRSTAQISSYKDFCCVADAMDYKANMRELRTFPEVRARLLAGLLGCSKMAFYYVLHR